MDWKDASTYPTELSLAQWRWQFLRRSPEYRKDWEQYRQDPDNPAAQKHQLFMFIDPDEVSPYEDYLIYAQPSEKQCFTLKWVFDLKKPIKPQLKRAEQRVVYLQNLAEKSDVFSVKNRRVSKNQHSKWIQYLRVLDAKEASTSHSAVGEVLFPNLSEADAKSKVSKYLKSAKELTTNFPSYRL